MVVRSLGSRPVRVPEGHTRTQGNAIRGLLVGGNVAEEPNRRFSYRDFQQAARGTHRGSAGAIDPRIQARILEMLPPRKTLARTAGVEDPPLRRPAGACPKAGFRQEL